MVLQTATLTIATLWPLADDARKLIAASHDEMQAIYTSSECHQLHAQALAEPNVQLLVARINGEAVGCIALVDKVTYGEIKRFFVARSARGHGIGGALMDALLAASRDIGLDTLRLETGDKLEPAMALYGRYGFEERGPFGEYAEAPSSVFMEWTRAGAAQQESLARTIA